MSKRTVKTLEEVRELPKGAVVLEDQYDEAFMKIESDYWAGAGPIPLQDVQIDLPATVIFEPKKRSK